MKTDFDKLLKTKHMLAWLSNNPFEEITATITKMFIKQSASTKMLEFKIINDPEWLTGGKKNEDGSIIVVRSGVAVSCNFTLQDNNGTYNLNGIFSWIGVNLDTKSKKTNMWMDLDGNMNEFGKNGALKTRIYELETSD